MELFHDYLVSLLLWMFVYIFNFLFFYITLRLFVLRVFNVFFIFFLCRFIFLAHPVLLCFSRFCAPVCPYHFSTFFYAFLPESFYDLVPPVHTCLLPLLLVLIRTNTSPQQTCTASIYFLALFLFTRSVCFLSLFWNLLSPLHLFVPFIFLLTAHILLPYCYTHIVSAS